MDRKTHKEQVIEDCENVETLLRLLADAAGRLFSAPVDAPDFETDEGPDYAHAVGLLRHYIEVATIITRGTDPDLDVALHAYSMTFSRAATKPALLERVN